MKTFKDKRRTHNRPAYKVMDKKETYWVEFEWELEHWGCFSVKEYCEWIKLNGREWASFTCLKKDIHKKVMDYVLEDMSHIGYYRNLSVNIVDCYVMGIK